MMSGLKDNAGGAPPILLLPAGEQQVVVACRIRPMTEEEIVEGATVVAHKVADDHMVVLLDPEEDHDNALRVNRSRERKYVFDVVSDARADQQEVYASSSKLLLSSVLEGYNATVFAYGATGAGKTYTMLGTENNPGVMYRTLHDLFVEIKKFEGKREYQVTMSYLEIYNELIRDLLAPSSSFLELREDAKGTIQVAGLSEIRAKTPEEVMDMLHKGNRARTQEPTKANKTSSRSHAVLQVNIKQHDVNKSNTDQVRFAKLYMIDLAGSERAAQTQNTGKRMIEGAHINRSLLALGNCINALSEKGNTKYVNYRDSKLTRILKDSLGGNSRTLMIAHISPASIHFEESRNTLNYADRAKYIKTKVRRNVVDVSYHIAQYKQIIQDLRNQVQLLREQRDDLEIRLTTTNEARFSRLGNNNNNNNTTTTTTNNTTERLRVEEGLKLKENIVQSYRKQIDARRALLEIDTGLMDVIHECKRNESIVEHHEASGENSPRNNKKSPDELLMDANTSDNATQRARAELRVLEQERGKLEKQRKTQLQDFETSKKDSRRLLEKVTKKMNVGEQRELLRLLTENFEFEMKTIELQAEIFSRDYSIKYKDLQLLRMSQHRSLCDTIIYQQRKLIQDNRILVPSDLEELYQLYSRDIDEGQLIHDLKSYSPRLVAGSHNGGKSAASTTLPFLSQIAEEDLTSASTSVTSFHLPGNASRRYPQSTLNAHRTLSDQDLFTRLHEDSTNSTDVGHDLLSATHKPVSYSHFNFDHASKLLTKGNSMGSISSESVDVPLNNGDTISGATRRKTHTTPPPMEWPSDSSPAFKNNTGQVKVDLRKQTQDIAARAAQRRANLHHKEVMADIGPVFPSDLITGKENSSGGLGGEIAGAKPKKTVTINDPPIYRLPGTDFRRTNSDSPDLNTHYGSSSDLDPFYSTSYNRSSRNSNKKRSTSHGSTANSRSNGPTPNLVVPREYY